MSRNLHMLPKLQIINLRRFTSVKSSKCLAMSHVTLKDGADLDRGAVMKDP